jgi:RNA polymerase sigma-70 factor (ECF subfamily)
MQEDDRSAVSRARDGDTDAFRCLVERHSRYLYGVARRVTGSAIDAEDVVQEAWLRAHRQFGQFEGRADVRTWLHRITVNCSIDWVRSRRHREDAHDPSELDQAASGAPRAEGEPLPDRLAASGQIQARVEQALGGLTSLERAAFVLRHLEGQSIEEVGTALGMKTSATKHSIFRAVRKMRQALEPFVREKGARCT